MQIVHWGEWIRVINSQMPNVAKNPVKHSAWFSCDESSRTRSQIVTQVHQTPNQGRRQRQETCQRWADVIPSIVDVGGGADHQLIQVGVHCEDHRRRVSGNHGSYGRIKEERGEDLINGSRNSQIHKGELL